MRTNLPPIESSTDSAAKTKLFFDEYGQSPLEFSANDVEAAIGFFMTNGFDRDAAEITAAVMLRQAKLENIAVFQLIDHRNRSPSPWPCPSLLCLISCALPLLCVSW